MLDNVIKKEHEQSNMIAISTQCWRYETNRYFLEIIYYYYRLIYLCITLA